MLIIKKVLLVLGQGPMQRLDNTTYLKNNKA